MLEVLTDRMGVPEIVVLLDHRLDQVLLRRATHLTNVDGPEFRKAPCKGHDRHLDEGDDRVPSHVVAAPLSGRKLNMAGSMQFEQKAAAQRVARRPVLLCPLPCLADLERERATTRSGIARDELSNKRDVIARECSPPILNHRIRLHGRHV